MGYWIFDWISLGIFGLNELTIDKVFINSGKGVSMESGQKWHFNQLINFKKGQKNNSTYNPSEYEKRFEHLFF